MGADNINQILRELLSAVIHWHMPTGRVDGEVALYSFVVLEQLIHLHIKTPLPTLGKQTVGAEIGNQGCSG